MASEAEELSEVNNSSNLTGREAASREGLIIAYSGLMIMAVVPILVGSLRSVTYHYNLRVSVATFCILLVNMHYRKKVNDQKTVYDCGTRLYFLSMPVEYCLVCISSLR